MEERALQYLKAYVPTYVNVSGSIREVIISHAAKADLCICVNVSGS